MVWQNDKMAKTTGNKPKSGKRRVPRKRAARTVGLEPLDCRLETSADLVPVISRVEKEGGTVLSPYRDPLGGHPLLIAILPIDRVQPTPYQRDLS